MKNNPVTPPEKISGNLSRTFAGRVKRLGTSIRDWIRSLSTSKHFGWEQQIHALFTSLFPEGSAYASYPFPPQKRLNPDIATILITSLKERIGDSTTPLSKDLVIQLLRESLRGKRGSIVSLIALAGVANDDVDKFPQLSGFTWMGSKGGNCATFVSSCVLMSGIQPDWDSTNLQGWGPLLSTSSTNTYVSESGETLYYINMNQTDSNRNPIMQSTKAFQVAPKLLDYLVTPTNWDQARGIQGVNKIQADIADYAKFDAGDLIFTLDITEDNVNQDHVSIIVGFGPANKEGPIFATYQEADNAGIVNIVPYAVDHGWQKNRVPVPFNETTPIGKVVFLDIDYVPVVFKN